MGRVENVGGEEFAGIVREGDSGLGSRRLLSQPHIELKWSERCRGEPMSSSEQEPDQALC